MPLHRDQQCGHLRRVCAISSDSRPAEAMRGAPGADSGDCAPGQRGWASTCLGRNALGQARIQSHTDGSPLSREWPGVELHSSRGRMTTPYNGLKYSNPIFFEHNLTQTLRWIPTATSQGKVPHLKTRFERTQSADFYISLCQEVVSAPV